MTYDEWLQSAAAYEHFSGLDGPSEEEERALELEIEREIDEAIERGGSEPDSHGTDTP